MELSGLLITLACIAAAVLGYGIGWLTRPKPVKYSASSYFHLRPDVYPVMQRWDADAVRSAREIH